MDDEELNQFEEFRDSLKYAINEAPNSYYSDLLQDILDAVNEEIENAETILRLQKEKQLAEQEREYWRDKI